VSDRAPQPPAKLGRKEKFSFALYERVLVRIESGELTEPAIEREGLSARQFYKRLQRAPELRDRFQQTQLERDKVRNLRRLEEAEMELKRRGIDGWSEPIFDAKGSLCGERRRFSDACLIFFLKHHKPEVYGDRPATVVATQVNITPDREKQILRDWRSRLGAVETATSVPEPGRGDPESLDGGQQ
jgi:hypothetical protein